VVPALIPEREREHREHDEHHAHSGSFARILQTIIISTATFLPAGTSIVRPRFIADEIGGLINGGHFLLRPLKSPQSRKMEVPNAVSVLGRRAVRIDEDVVGRVRTRTRDVNQLGVIGGGAFVLFSSTPRLTPGGRLDASRASLFV
jgi:hypothetical protein